MKSVNVFALFSLSAFGGVYGWGASGHQTVGYIAMQFLLPNALNFVQTTLGSTYSNSLGPAATWADSVKSTYPWSSALHYVDANDSPPTSCSLSQSRDCADGRCILTAITNYTTRVTDTTLPASQIQEALLFIDHFLGDITQPLHVEATAAGGNSITVKCNKVPTNLHSLWDSGMINILLPNNYGNSVTTWANSLVSRIKTGDYASQASTWISCTSPTGGCPVVWGTDTNSFDCSEVFSYTSYSDLCTSAYYTNSVPIIEAQIAKGGYRLAAWLNVLFDGRPM